MAVGLFDCEFQLQVLYRFEWCGKGDGLFSCIGRVLIFCGGTEESHKNRDNRLLLFVLDVLYMVYIRRFMEVVSVLPSVTEYELLKDSRGDFLNSILNTSYLCTVRYWGIQLFNHSYAQPFSCLYKIGVLSTFNRIL